MAIVQQYEQIAWWLARWAGGDRAAHISAGLVIWIVSALALRLPLRSPWPLLIVFLAEIGNEIVDYIAKGRLRPRDTRGDVIATLVWPALLYIALHVDRRLRA